MSDEEIFAQVTKTRGGVASDSDDFNVQERVAQLLEQNSKRKDLIKNFPRIVFGFLNDDCCNAFATKFQDVYIIGMNAGTQPLMFDLFLRMMSHPDILKNIGSPSEEDPYPDSEKLDDYFTNVSQLVVDGHYRCRGPKGLYRKNYASHLLKLALDYYVEHELSHIMFGHVDYMIENQYKVFVSPRVRNFNIQTLEMDADCTAIARMILYAFYCVDNQSFLPEGIRPFYRDYQTACVDIFFAVYNSIRIQGDFGYKHLLPGEIDHPEPRQRQKMVAGIFEAMASKHPLKLHWATLWNELTKHMVESEKAYQRLTKKSLNPEVFSKKYYANNSLSLDLLDNWKDVIRDQLLPYTFLPLAP